MKIKMMVFAALIIFIATGCSSIPRAAIDVSKQVSVGITAISENGIEMTKAWEESAYNILDERWSKVYKKAETSYRTQKNIGTGTALTPQQQEDVAGLAALIRGEIRQKIEAEAENMRAIISANTRNTLLANESITDLLVSAEAVATSRQAVLREVGDLIPVPPTISTFISNALETANL